MPGNQGKRDKEDRDTKAINMLVRLSELGIEVVLEGTDLRVRGPSTSITAELAEEMLSMKPDLIKALTAERDDHDYSQFCDFCDQANPMFPIDGANLAICGECLVETVHTGVILKAYLEEEE